MNAPGPPLLVDVSDGIATITLNRPDSRNALNLELLRALPRAVRECDARDDVAAIVLTGADPAFCAGLDLKDLGAGKLSAEVAPEPNTTEGAVGVRRGPLPHTSVPVIGAVNGVAVTGGLELALSCDLLIASERARFADTHARVGIMPGWGLTVLLPQAVGLRRARQMSITGNYVDARTACEWGLVNQVVAHDELMATCRQLASDVATNDRAAVARMLQTYREGSELTGAGAWALEGDVARSWLPSGVADPAEVERRRRDVVARGRSQVS